MAFEPLTFFVHLLPLKVSAATLSHFSNYKFVNHTSLCLSPWFFEWDWNHWH